MKKYFRKTLSLVLIGVLLFLYVAYPALSFAQTATDTPTPTVDPSSSTPTPTSDPSSTATITPTDTPTPTIDPNASPTDSPTPTPTIDPSSAPTDTPTPTVDPNASPTPTPTIDPSLSNTPTPTVDPNATPAPSDPTNTGIVDNTATSSAVTGGNSITATASADTSGNNSSGGNGSPGSQNSSSGNTNIGTGEALSLINSDTGINVTSINSNVIVQTLNIFVAQNGSIDLSDPFTIAAQAISDHPNSPVINVSVTNVNNFAYITNEIASEAITGDNLINTADQSASITTGDAYSVVSLLNKVNFTIDNSTIHILTINIFGRLNGNIILPDMNASTDCNSCGMNIASTNNATVTNNVTSAANSGGNTATGSATITTGNAESAVNNINLVNANLYGTTAQVLFINDFGLWTGNFIGWGNLDPTAGGASLALFNLFPSGTGTGSGTCSTCSGTLGNVLNGAQVVNDISSLADSGGNTLNANGSIKTGNAYSAVSLINFINSNFLNSIGFFGFINIFGDWTGDIGGASEFAAQNANPDNNNPPVINNGSSTDTSSTDTVQEQGGQLAITNSNNVGAFVYPGDTVTFFVKTTNTGTGKVYGAKLNLFLIYRGNLAGGTQFDLGDIQPGHSVEVNTGFVLSKLAPPGYYTSRAYVTGSVGPDNSQVSATADSFFTVFGAILGTTKPNTHGPKIAVLGTKTNGFDKASAAKIAQDLLYFSLLILVAFAYISLRLIRKREYVYAFFQSDSFKEKLYTLRMLML